MEEETSALKKSSTWESVDIPNGKMIVGCKWVLTMKYKSNGSVDKYNAHLVVIGYTKTFGIDYQKTFSPVAKMNSVRILISLAVSQGWPLLQFNVKNVFLHDNLKEDYMTTTLGFNMLNVQWKVCKLKKILYELKQSLGAWFGRFRIAIVKTWLTNHTLFMKRQSQKVTTLIVYVDNIVVTWKLQDSRAIWLRNSRLKTLAHLNTSLGLRLLSQNMGFSSLKVCIGFIEGFGNDPKPCTTPIESNH